MDWQKEIDGIRKGLGSSVDRIEVAQGDLLIVVNRADTFRIYIVADNGKLFFQCHPYGPDNGAECHDEIEVSDIVSRVLAEIPKYPH